MNYLKAEERKAKAVDIMQRMMMGESYIKDFNNGIIHCFNVTSITPVEATSALNQKVQEIEAKYNCTVFAVTHDIFSFGECYSLLLVTEEPHLSPVIVTGESVSRQHAYVWNLDYDHFCEFGPVDILCWNGDICRLI